MIKKMPVENREVAEKILALQIPSYEVEARWIQFDGIPQLKETVEELQACGETFYGYVMGDALVGAVSYKMKGKILDFHRLIVHPNHFRKGIARKLVRHVLDRESEAEKAQVYTGAKNTPAKNFVEVSNVEVAAGVFLSFFEKQIK